MLQGEDHLARTKNLSSRRDTDRLEADLQGWSWSKQFYELTLLSPSYFPSRLLLAKAIMKPRNEESIHNANPIHFNLSGEGNRNTDTVSLKANRRYSVYVGMLTMSAGIFLPEIFLLFNQEEKIFQNYMKKRTTTTKILV